MLDEFTEWDRFMDIYEVSRTPDRALAVYKKQRNGAELESYKRDVKRGLCERCKECGRDWWQDHDEGCAG